MEIVRGGTSLTLAMNIKNSPIYIDTFWRSRIGQMLPALLDGCDVTGWFLSCKWNRKLYGRVLGEVPNTLKVSAVHEGSVLVWILSLDVDTMYVLTVLPTFRLVRTYISTSW